jgi:hypothetical protein
MKTWNFMPDFSKALTEQLKSDFSRHGDTWLELPRASQESRIEGTIADYFDDYYTKGTPVPWLKIAGNAMIAWIREQRPDIWKE